jgi:hypothetical protein
VRSSGSVFWVEPFSTSELNTKAISENGRLSRGGPDLTPRSPAGDELSKAEPWMFVGDASALRRGALKDKNGGVAGGNASSAERFAPGFESWSLVGCEAGWVIEAGVKLCLKGWEGGEVDPEGRGRVKGGEAEAGPQLVGSPSGAVSRLGRPRPSPHILRPSSLAMSRPLRNLNHHSYRVFLTYKEK